MFLFDLPFIAAEHDKLLERLENPDFALFIALADSALFNLHQKPLVHLYFLQLAVASRLFVRQAPASIDLSFLAEQALLLGFVEEQLDPARVKVHSVKALRLALSGPPAQDRVERDYELVDVEVAELAS